MSKEMEHKEYQAKVKECSKDLSIKEKISLKSTEKFIKLDSATKVEPVDIDVDYYAVLQIHNEKSDNKDYEVYVLIDKDGQGYITGSPSFFRSFMDIWDEMMSAEADGKGEPWKIRVSRRPSKNREGKDFLIADII